MDKQQKLSIADKLYDAIIAVYGDDRTQFANKAFAYKCVFGLKVKGVRLGDLAEADDDMMHIASITVGKLRSASFVEDIEVDIEI